MAHRSSGLEAEPEIRLQINEVADRFQARSQRWQRAKTPQLEPASQRRNSAADAAGEQAYEIGNSGGTAEGIDTAVGLEDRERTTSGQRRQHTEHGHERRAIRIGREHITACRSHGDQAADEPKKAGIPEDGERSHLDVASHGVFERHFLNVRDRIGRQGPVLDGIGHAYLTAFANRYQPKRRSNADQSLAGTALTIGAKYQKSLGDR